MYLSNRRRLPRFPFHSHGTLWMASDAYAGTLMDISLKGALFKFEPSAAFEVNSECKLTVYYAGKSAFLTVDGRIVHVHDDFAGIAFTHTSRTLEQSLRRLVDLNLGMPRLLERDIPALLR